MLDMNCTKNDCIECKTHFKLNITPNYLGSITRRCSGKEPALLPRRPDTREWRKSSLQITWSTLCSSVSLSFLFLLFLFHRLCRFSNHFLGCSFNLGGKRSSTHYCQACWSSRHLISGHERSFFFKLSNRRNNTTYINSFQCCRPNSYYQSCY